MDFGDGTDDWLAPYIDAPYCERAAIAERIKSTALLPSVIDVGVSYPSDAMAQALTGDFTEKAWARFKTATDIYCDRNRLELGEDSMARVSWSFDLHYPACYYDPTGLTSTWACPYEECAVLDVSRPWKYTACRRRRQFFGQRLRVMWPYLEECAQYDANPVRLGSACAR